MIAKRHDGLKIITSKAWYHDVKQAVAKFPELREHLDPPDPTDLSISKRHWEGVKANWRKNSPYAVRKRFTAHTKQDKWYILLLTVLDLDPKFRQHAHDTHLIDGPSEKDLPVLTFGNFQKAMQT